MRLVFGSRGSELALAQTRMVMRQLVLTHPEIDLELSIIKTTGDNKPDARLEEIGGLGAFTREIELALLHHEIDVAVHSLKDLPTRQPEGLAVAAVAGRERPNDALISATGCTIKALPERAVVGTSSLRRKAQLLAMRPDLQIRELRGNVPTRMRRVAGNDLDAVILAVAGLARLGLEKEHGIWEIPLEQMLPAPGQGALALETRAGDAEVIALLTPLHNEEAALAVQCERAVLRAFGGGCRAPLGAYAHLEGEHIFLQAFAADMETGRTVYFSRDVLAGDAERLGEEGGAMLRHELQTPGKPCATDVLPLRNRRIVITRAPHQAASFGAMLEEAGATVVYLPLIEITPVPDVALPDRQEHFDWLIFTSVNAVSAFEKALHHHDRGIKEYRRCRVAAIGAATAAAAEAAGLQVDLMPEAHVSEALAAALLGLEPQPEGKRVLLPQSSRARTALAEALTECGMKVCAVTVYRTGNRVVAESDVADLLAFQPECITFFSPSAVSAYSENGLREKLLQQHGRVIHASIGPVTTDALRHADCSPIVEAACQNESDLACAIAEALRKNVSA